MAIFSYEEIRGVIPALVTPFDRDENFSERGMRKLVDHLLGKGVHGLYLTGSTGEGFLMTPDERKIVVDTVIDQVAGRVPIIVHIGAIGTKISIDLARHAERAGADAISSVPPFYWKFDNDDVFNYYRDITGATSLPMIVYNIPLAGLVGYEQIRRFATLKGVKGIKYTATTHFEMMRMKEELGKQFIVYSGCDEMAMSGLSFGADGIIGSFYNLMPELFIDMYHAMKVHDLKLAEARQRTANIIIMYATQKNHIGIMKRALSWMGVNAGYCRSPFRNFSPEEEREIRNELKVIRDKHEISGVDFLDVL